MCKELETVYQNPSGQRISVAGELNLYCHFSVVECLLFCEFHHRVFHYHCENCVLFLCAQISSHTGSIT